MLLNVIMNNTSLERLLRKYPEIVLDNLEELNKSRDSNSKHFSYKVKRKRTSKIKMPLHVKHLKRRVFKRLQQDNLFLCLKCKEILQGPVTLECGHTFCKRCLDCNSPKTSCFVCTTEDDGRRSVNILVNDVLNKWRNVRESCRQKTEILFINGPINASDFECILCSQCLLDPVTTTCGHTFCRSCLARVLDHGLSCPLCMSILRATDLTRKTTQVLVDALRILLPEEHKKCIAALRNEVSFSEENSQVPVFVCTNAFPGVACPLFVYEPRYRLLTRRCLQSNSKTFAMAVNTGGGNSSNCDNVEKFASYGTILEVRDAVYMSDGTSILSTVGLRRFKVVNRGEKDGYDTAEIQYIRDTTISSDKLQAVVSLHTDVRRKAVTWLQSLNPIVFKEIERSLGPMPQVEQNWTRLPDGPTWIWWLVPILPLSSQLQLGFLSSVSIEKRLRAIEKLLDHLNDRSRMVISDAAVKCVTTTITTATTSTTTTTTTTTANRSCNFFERESRESTGSTIDVL